MATRHPVVHHPTLAARFWSKVDKDGANGCWLWRAHRDRSGYGRLSSGGRHGYMLVAARVSWFLHYGPIPDGLDVLHNCPGGDNPSCVNPGHLFLGTQQENIADMIGKGRGVLPPHTPGALSGSAKLTWSMVDAIRARAAGGERHAALAREYGVTRPNVSLIVAGRTWDEAWR